MKCYIYFIINKVTNQRYVGQTTNFSRRKMEHFSNLEKGKHPNQKLQNSYNKYGKDNFIIEKITFDNISKDELNEQEKYYIQKYNTYINGFNLTIGGTGGDCRSKLTFEQFCLAYFGCIKYQGMTNRVSKYLKVDSACIASIVRKDSYDYFRQQAEQLSVDIQENYISNFIKIFDIENNPPWIKQKSLTDELTFQIICVCSTYGRGTEAVIAKHFNLSKGFLYHLFTGNGRKNIIDKYINTSQDDIEKLGTKFFQEWDLQSYSKRKIPKQFHNLAIHYGVRI